MAVCVYLSLEKMLKDRLASFVHQNQIGQMRRRAVDDIPVPRSSSPVTVYVDLPGIVDPAFSTIEWEDFEDQGTERKQEKDSDTSQVDESKIENLECALDLMAESILENSMSAPDLVPFQGCIIPPLTPQRDLNQEDSETQTPTETGSIHGHNEALWVHVADCDGQALRKSMAVNKKLHETLQGQQDELDSLEERNLHLRQLANRAKHLASVLEKLMTVSEPLVGEAALPCNDASLTPSKRQRLDKDCETTESSDSVEEMLRDISTRCNAVLLGTSVRPQQEPETIRVFGSFAGLQMTTPESQSSIAEDSNHGESLFSFRTCVREHSTIKTQVFPHGHAFTSKTQEGGFRFRWVPNQS